MSWLEAMVVVEVHAEEGNDSEVLGQWVQAAVGGAGEQHTFGGDLTDAEAASDLAGGALSMQRGLRWLVGRRGARGNSPV
jgi:hypothetical protein